MSEANRIAERRSAFDGADAVAGRPDGARFALRIVPPAVRLSLRLPGAGVTGGQAAGFDLAQPINALRETGSGDGAARLSARLGPDEWLLIAGGDTDDADALARQLAADLGTRTHTIVDISHRNVAIEVAGDAAADVLNTGCPLDLGDAAFPAGTATRTLYGKAEIILMRIGAAQQPTFRVECWRSFGRYLDGYLRDAASLIGVDG